MTNPLRLDYIDPATLTENPANWRVHPPGQVAAFEGLLAEVGWTGALLVNARTGHLLDGHARLKIARCNRLPAVPVLVGEWPAELEPKIIASHDTIGLMAEFDGPAWVELLKGCNTGSAELAGHWAELTADWGLIPPDPKPRREPSAKGAAGAAGAEGDDDTPTEGGLEPPITEPDPGAGGDPAPGSPEPAPDILWPSSNPWGIPDLDVRMQAEGPQFPVTIWGSVGRTRPMPGTWAFYTDDKRFSTIFDDPAAILASGPFNAVEPNYSTHSQMPRAFVLWQVYQKRYVNRFWQSRGIRTFVDVNVCAMFDDLNFLGVPRGWRAFATRSHAGGTGLDAAFDGCAAHAGTDRLAFLVYGGGSATKAYCGERGWFWAPEEADVARGRA